MSAQLAADQQMQDFVVMMLLCIFCACAVFAIVVTTIVRIADYWFDNGERIKGNISVALNVTVWLCAYAWESVCRFAVYLWRVSVPDFETLVAEERDKLNK
jgi:hypothetical protein